MPLWKTLRAGERGIVWNRNGEGKEVAGPHRVGLWFGKTLERLHLFVANEHQYLQVEFLDGHREHVPGPVSRFCNSLYHRSIVVQDAYELNANEVIVVYRKVDSANAPGQQDSHIERRLVYGPTVHIPTADEWIHNFVWHGSLEGNKTKKIPGATKFTKLRVMPDQFYYNITDVRTKDEGLIVVKVMIFFELKDIESMLDLSHDPIADFINAIAADVVAFASQLKYEEFMDQSSMLNDLSSFPQLCNRAKQIGYSITKVVFRGLQASDSLQRMNDDAVASRIRLKLQLETDEQAQSLRDFSLKKEIERSEQEMQMKTRGKENEMLLERRTHEEKVRQLQEENELSLRQQREQDKEQEDHLQKLQSMGVNLTSFLVAQNQKVDKIIRFEGSAPQVIVNSE